MIYLNEKMAYAKSDKSLSQPIFQKSRKKDRLHGNLV